jgi:hypothetical protein
MAMCAKIAFLACSFSELILCDFGRHEDGCGNDRFALLPYCDRPTAIPQDRFPVAFSRSNEIRSETVIILFRELHLCQEFLETRIGVDRVESGILT